MAVRDHDPGPDDDELEDDPDEPDDDQDEDGDDDDDDDEDDPEDRGATVTPLPSAAPAAVSPAAGAPEPKRWLPLNDPTVLELAVTRRDYRGSTRQLSTRYLGRILRPFPVDLAAELKRLHGPGRYTVSERGAGGAYLGSRTVVVSDESPANGHDPNPHVEPPPPIIPSSPASGDWKVAAITTAGALVTAVISAIVTRRPDPPARSSISEALEIARLLNVPNEERAKMFREAVELARELEPSRAPAESSGVDLGKIAEAVTAVLQAVRPPASGPTAGAGSSLPAQVSPPAHPREITAEDQERRQARLLEAALVHEIQRAIAAGDGPDTLVVLLQSWLDPVSLSWLESSDEADVLAQLPARFPTHAELFNQPPVQSFLRETLKMLREDAEAASAGHGIPAAAGDTPATS